MNSYSVYEVDIADIKVVEPDWVNEATAKAKAQFLNEYGEVQMMVISSSFELLLHREIYDSLQAAGVKNAEAIVVTTPEDANQHVRNLFGNIPASISGKVAWLEYNQPYYKEGGAGYFLRMESGNNDEKSLKEYLGSFIGFSHSSVQKLLDIGRSDCSQALLADIDAGKCSIDKAYKICKSDSSDEDDVSESLKEHSSVTVLTGNTKNYKLPEEEKNRLARLFATVTRQVSEQLSQTKIPAAFNLRPNNDRKGKLESYSLTYKSPELNFTGIIQPKEKEVDHE